MQYCDLEDKTALITWRFPGDKSKEFVSPITPVVVLVIPLLSTGSWVVDIYDNITNSVIIQYSGTSEEYPTVTGRTVKTNGTNRVVGGDGNFSAGNVGIRSANFTPNTGTGWTIKIEDTLGRKLFEDSKMGNSPPTYEVACGDGCPPGYIKCEHPKYPGYCCIPCQGTASKINNLAAKVRAK